MQRNHIHISNSHFSTQQIPINTHTIKPRANLPFVSKHPSTIEMFETTFYITTILKRIQNSQGKKQQKIYPTSSKNTQNHKNTLPKTLNNYYEITKGYSTNAIASSPMKFSIAIFFTFNLKASGNAR